MLTLDQLTIGYAGSQPLLCGASLMLAPGTVAALVGRNGTGKSTLLRVMAGLTRPISGHVEVDGRNLLAVKSSERARLIAVVTTERPPALSRMRCRELVALGRAPHTGWTGRLTAADEAAVDEAMRLTSTEQWASRRLSTLSDGQRQRVMTARALAQQTPVLLLDEPTSFLDLPGRVEMAALLRRLASETGRTIVYSTHELDIARRHADTLLLMAPPRLLEGREALDALPRLLSCEAGGKGAERQKK